MEDKYPSWQEREVYANAVATSLGLRPDWESDEMELPPDDVFIKYIQLSLPSTSEDMHSGRHDLEMRKRAPTFNYEKWIRGAAILPPHRRVTGDLSLT